MVMHKGCQDVVLGVKAVDNGSEEWAHGRMLTAAPACAARMATSCSFSTGTLPFSATPDAATVQLSRLMRSW